jgi:hypothetical protein
MWSGFISRKKESNGNDQQVCSVDGRYSEMQIPYVCCKEQKANEKSTEKSKLQSCWSLLAWSEDMGSASGFRGYQPVLIWHEVCFYKLVDFIHAVSVRV